MSREAASLLPVARGTSKRDGYFKISFYISSRPACLILLWNFSVLLGYKLICNTDALMQVSKSSAMPIIVIAVFSLLAALSPMVGLLADIKLSRHRSVLCSSYIIMVVIMLLPFMQIVSAFMVSTSTKILTVGIIFFFAVMAFSFVVFLVNAFQFGMDQLHDSSTQELLSYIHWYVWLYYVSSTITELTWNLVFYSSGHLFGIRPDKVRISGYCIEALILISIPCFLTLSLCVFKKRKVWFLLEPAGVNPYKLVYRVIKFACQHKVPLKRSAFTYCEDELPSRLDLGKQKYGGPFTTKQVEDVKAFLGILKILLSLCLAFYIQTVTQPLLAVFARHSKIYLLWFINGTHHELHPEGMSRHIIISNGLLSPLLVVICIPLYLCLIRPRILYHIPGMFKRIGMGIILMILSLLCAFVMDFMVHLKKTEEDCMFSGYAIFHYNRYIHLNDSTGLQDIPKLLYQNVYFLISQHILSSLVNMLMDIAVLEFICSQSPYSMKGLVFGLLFSMRSLFQALAIIPIIPFGALWKIEKISCGSAFYLMNIIIAIVTLGIFSHAAKKYKYRIMNEPSNEYLYAEEYYSNIQ